MKFQLVASNKIHDKQMINMKKLALLIISIMAGIINSFAQSNFATVKVKMNSLNDGDVATLFITEFGDPLYKFDKNYDCTIVNHSFHFKIPVRDHPVHVGIQFKEKVWNPRNGNKLNRLALNNYYIENGDNISGAETNGLFNYKGRGAEKFRIIRHLNEIGGKYDNGYSRVVPQDLVILFRKKDSLFVDRINFLETKVLTLSPKVFNLLKADALGDLYSRSNFVSSMTDSIQKVALGSLKHYKSIIPSKYLLLKEFNKEDVLKFSSAYTYWGIAEKYKFDSCLSVKKPFFIQNYYNFIIHNYTGSLKERLIVNLIASHSDSSENISSIVNSSLSLLKFKQFRNYVYEVKSHRLPGALAFNFTLPDTSGKMHGLSDYKGKVVVIDFWFTGCGSCIAVKPFLEKIEARFKGKAVVFLTINNDKRKESWIKSVRSGIYTSNLSIDLFTEGRAYEHPVSKYYNIYGGPNFILIDKYGRLALNPEDPRFDNGIQLTRLIETELNK
jgi:thiol-disulfide isomerase/thioredoxin